jgi:hypothetical protein
MDALYPTEAFTTVDLNVRNIPGALPSRRRHLAESRTGKRIAKRQAYRAMEQGIVR